MFNKTVCILSANKTLVSKLKSRLSTEGISVIPIHDFIAPIKEIHGKNLSLIIIDSPDSSVGGFRLCREIIKTYSVPIILLVNGEESERIKGLEAGADDCMSRPVDVGELIANVHAIFRRTEKSLSKHSSEQKPIVVNNLVIDENNHVVKLDKKTIELTIKEFKLLLVLAREKGRIFNRQALITQVWGEEFLESNRTVDVNICRLRKKIEPDAIRPNRILCVRGFGYKLEK